MIQYHLFIFHIWFSGFFKIYHCPATSMVFCLFHTICSMGYHSSHWSSSFSSSTSEILRMSQAPLMAC